ncbi:unnamed protein product [Ostreobium quekettii]|uniref:Uncharacterized protein n=1 Tax=Ostreobium quekettii TaxID=121088 RepID=A0A8S1J7M7_9CHLO|nr:unnamed protein product [Ostreobium quekettii]|eukprot:evm.model.scf_1036.2 EVM.evm.TU.scf_1036.2   scf_1036:27576-29546(+)
MVSGCKRPRPDDLESLASALRASILLGASDDPVNNARLLRTADALLQAAPSHNGPASAAPDCLHGLSTVASDAWRYLDSDGAGALKRVCSAACGMVASKDRGAVWAAAEFIQRMASVAPDALMRAQGLERALAWMLSLEVTSPLAFAGVWVLGRLISSALGVNATRCGAVVEAEGASMNGDASALYWTSSLGAIVNPACIGELCRLLRHVADRCTVADLRVACATMQALSMLLHNRNFRRVMRDLLGVLEGQKLLFTLLRVTKVAFRLPSPLLLQATNDLLWRYCTADRERHKELYLLVFESELEFTEKATESREAVVECLFWVNAFNYPTCRSSDVDTAVAWVRRYHFLWRLYRYMRRVRLDEDHNWFLVCANTYASLYPILFKLSTQQHSLLRPFQNELRDSGLLDITHSFIDGLVALIQKCYGAASIETPEEQRAELEVMSLTLCNVVYFYTLCMHDNKEVLQYCEVCGALDSVMSALEVSDLMFAVDNDRDLVRLAARTQEEVLGLLCTLMFHKMNRTQPDRWPLDWSFIQDGQIKKIVEQLGHLAHLDVVVLTQKISVVRKRLEVLFYLSHYTRNLLSRAQPQIVDALKKVNYSKTLVRLKPIVEGLLMLKGGTLPKADERNIEDIESYYVLLQHVYLQTQTSRRGGTQDK